MSNALKIENILWLLLFVLIIFTAANSLRAQNDPYNALISRGQDLQNQRFFDRAEEFYRQAGKLNPKNPRAWLQLGKLNYILHRWHRAKPWLKKVIYLRPNHIEAHYLLAICDREDAVGRDQVLMRIMWHNSQKNFRKVIQFDSTYKQVFYEFALLRRNQDNHEEAIDLCLKQIKIKPRLPQPRYEIFKLYDRFLYLGGESFLSLFKNTDNYQIHWLKKRKSKYDLYFLGEKYRRLGRFSQADSIFRKLIREEPLPFSKTPVYLSLVRLYYQTGHPQLAEKTYWKAVDNLDSFFDIRFIYDDAKYIMSDQDLHISFKNINAIKKFYHQFWNRKNPLGSTTYNTRLEEHYLRLVEAEKNYIYLGMRLSIYNPDRLHILKIPEVFSRNDKFNDRGMIYIRYGKPDDIARSTGQDVRSNESWLYKATRYNPRTIFHFEVSEHAPSNDWKLVAVPTDPRMLESRLGWDQNLDRYYMSGDALEQSAALHELEMEAQKNTSRALSKDRPTWKGIQTIPIYLAAARFRGNKNVNEYEIFMSMPQKKLFPTGNFSNLHLQFGIALYDSLWNQIYKKQITDSLFNTDSLHFSHEQYLHLFDVSSPLSKLYFAVHVQDLDSNRIGGHKFALHYKPFSKHHLELSDLILAYNIKRTGGKGPFIRHGLQIIPNPTQRFGQDQLIHLYFEIYDLTPSNEQTRYRITTKIDPVKQPGNLFRAIANLFKGKRKQFISISRDQQGASPTSYEYSAYDIHALSSGTYRFSITVQDLISGEKRTQDTVFQIE